MYLMLRSRVLVLREEDLALARHPHGCDRRMRVVPRAVDRAPTDGFGEDPKRIEGLLKDDTEALTIGIIHGVDVEAETLYEAAGLGSRG